MISLLFVYETFVKNIESFDKKKFNIIHYTKYIQSIRIAEYSYTQTEDLVSRCLLWKICMGWYFTTKLIIIIQFYKTGNSLRQVQKVLFERVYCIQTIRDPIISIQVHDFGNTSERAYGCCVYFRFLWKSIFGGITKSVYWCRGKYFFENVLHLSSETSPSCHYLLKSPC